MSAQVKSAQTIKQFVEFLCTPSQDWVQNALFEQMRDYLRRGRRFERRNLDQLQDEWVTSFRLFVRQHVGSHVGALDDLGAELRLRAAPFPAHLVTAEIEQLRCEIRYIDPDSFSKKRSQLGIPTEPKALC